LPPASCGQRELLERAALADVGFMRGLLSQHDGTAPIEADNVERFLPISMPMVAMVAIDLLDMAVLRLTLAPSKHHSPVGQEHGRTIPLAAIQVSQSGQHRRAAGAQQEWSRQSVR
jgi:hypothetical protein